MADLAAVIWVTGTGLSPVATSPRCEAGSVAGSHMWPLGYVTREGKLERPVPRHTLATSCQLPDIL